MSVATVYEYARGASPTGEQRLFARRSVGIRVSVARGQMPYLSLPWLEPLSRPLLAPLPLAPAWGQLPPDFPRAATGTPTVRRPHQSRRGSHIFVEPP
jgi:hypothetical protein